MNSAKLVNMLLKYKAIKPEQAKKALEVSRQNGKDVIQSLVDLGFISEERLLRIISQAFHVQIAEFPEEDLPEQLIKTIPPDIARKYNVFPYKKKGRLLIVATTDPTNMELIDNLAFLTGYRIGVAITTEKKLKQLINKYYGEESKAAEALKEAEQEANEAEVVEEKEESIESELEVAKDAPVVKYVNALLVDAVRSGASDIHIEPFEKFIRVRFRIDGTLHELPRPPLRWKHGIIARIKILSKLDIAERRLPQDGHIKLRLKEGGKEKVIDFRVSTLPVKHGEKAVLRILDKSNLTLDLQKLGFEKEALEKFMYAISRPYGIVLVTGPTGSGKTTTLYSALSILNKPDVNIMTAEDPVEYDFPGLNQVQIREEIGLTFAAALRSFLRQDPDIIMVGEIRDEETASIAVKAALTGHLVLSTLHTNDAPSTITRLIDMGIPPYLVADSLVLIQAQRLVRKLCPKCKKPYKPSAKELKSIGLQPSDLEGKTVYKKGDGCDVCRGSGYKGREGIYEVMLITPEIREMILERRPISEIREKAREQGMLTLREAAILKFLKGITSLEEVIARTMEG